MVTASLIALGFIIGLVVGAVGLVFFVYSLTLFRKSIAVSK